MAVKFRVAITECISGPPVNRWSGPCVCVCVCVWVCVVCVCVWCVCVCVCVSVTVVSIQPSVFLSFLCRSFHVLLRLVWKVRGLQSEYRVFWGMALWGCVQTYRCLGGTFCNHLQGRIKATTLMTEDVKVYTMYCWEIFVTLHCVTS